MLTNNSDIGTFIIVTTLLILLLIGFIIMIVLLQKRRQLNHQQQMELQKNGYEKKLLTAQVEIQEQTMKDISQEIHDNIRGKLSVSMLYLYMIEWEKPDDVRFRVETALELLEKVVKDMDHLSQSLSSYNVVGEGLHTAVSQELAYISKLGKFETRLHVDGSLAFLHNNPMELIIFRIVQEALSNSVRHARQASLLEVTIENISSELLVRVRDDGKVWEEKPDPERKGGGMGLQNMRKRSQLLKGKLAIQHIPLKGTTVSLTIPMETEKSES